MSLDINRDNEADWYIKQRLKVKYCNFTERILCLIILIWQWFKTGVCYIVNYFSLSHKYTAGISTANVEERNCVLLIIKINKAGEMNSLNLNITKSALCLGEINKKRTSSYSFTHVNKNIQTLFSSFQASVFTAYPTLPFSWIRYRWLQLWERHKCGSTRN